MPPWEILVTAAMTGKCVLVTYRSEGDNIPFNRLVEPYSYRSEAGKTFLMAFDLDHNDHIRSYDVSEIFGFGPSAINSQLRWEVEITGPP